MSESQRRESSDEASSRSGSDDSDTYPNGDTMTIKAEYGDDLIAFHIPASAATLTTLKKETWEGFIKSNKVNIGLTWKDTIANLNLSDIVDEQISGVEIAIFVGKDENNSLDFRLDEHKNGNVYELVGQTLRQESSVRNIIKAAFPNEGTIAIYEDRIINDLRIICVMKVT
ncbi:hypothetical protein Tco_1086229 [Tanacetum coccineum]